MDDTFMKLMSLKAKGFCCAQIILILALEAQGKTNPDLVRSVGGLCFGIHAGEICGALSGGVCLISLYAGKGDAEETSDERQITMMVDLMDWFRGVATDEYGGIRCDEILKKFPDRSICGQIVADIYEKCMDILMSNGFDPTVSKNG
jgi:C_GCAxxG_C_C family probable redox protein